MSQSTFALRAGPLSALRLSTLGNLAFGGYVALMAWEIWARVITAWILGGPLEPPALVQSLGKAWFGVNLSLPTATGIHYALGILGYPVLYYLVSRLWSAWDFWLDVLVWLAFTGACARLWTLGRFGWDLAAFWAVVTLLAASRFINPWPLVRRSLSWGAFTWFNALGIFAPLAGLPFLLLEWGGGLSFMSYVGHVLFGFILAYVFERREAAPAPGATA